MSFAAQFVGVEEDDTCELEESSVGQCPLCCYQDDNIIRNIAKVEASLSGKIQANQIYTILCDMYEKNAVPLRRQGKKLLPLTTEICAEHFTRHVINTSQQIAEDIHYCSKMQRHYQKNIGLRNGNSGLVVLNPSSVNEYVKISRHKLELVKYFNTVQKRKQASETSTTPYAFT